MRNYSRTFSSCTLQAAFIKHIMIAILLEVEVLKLIGSIPVLHKLHFLLLPYRSSHHFPSSSLQPQMVKHCDQLKTSLRIEPVIAPAIWPFLFSSVCMCMYKPCKRYQCFLIRLQSLVFWPVPYSLLLKKHILAYKSRNSHLEPLLGSSFVAPVSPHWIKLETESGSISGEKS